VLPGLSQLWLEEKIKRHEASAKSRPGNLLRKHKRRRANRLRKRTKQQGWSNINVEAASDAPKQAEKSRKELPLPEDVHLEPATAPRQESSGFDGWEDDDDMPRLMLSG